MTETIEIPDSIKLERKDWEELQRDVHTRLKNDISLIKQRLLIFKVCEEELKKFPDVPIEAPEAEEAAKEIEDMAEVIKDKEGNIVELKPVTEKDIK